MHLRLGQIVDQPSIGSFGGDSAHAQCLFETLRTLKLQIAKERADGGKARVSRSRAVAAAFLDVVEKRQYKIWADILNGEVARPTLQPRRCETHQQHECARVSGDGVRTCVAFTRQMFTQELGKIGSEN